MDVSVRLALLCEDNVLQSGRFIRWTHDPFPLHFEDLFMLK